MHEQEVTISARPTLCEIIYHNDPDENSVFEDVYTPYRYRGLSAQTRASTGYGQYDPTTVGCRTPQNFVSPNNRTNTALSLYSAHGGSPSRAHTVQQGSYYPSPTPTCTHGPSNSNKRPERAKTAPCTSKSLPVLSAQRQNTESRMSSLSRGVTSLHNRCEVEQERLKWVPALNTWVSQAENQSPAPYISFVNSLNPGDKDDDSGLEIEGHELPVLPCSRFLSHMHMRDEQLKKLKLDNQRLKKDRPDVSLRRSNTLPPQQKPSRIVIHRPAPRSNKRVTHSVPATNVNRTTSPKNVTSPRLESPAKDNDKDDAKGLEHVEEVAEVEKVSVSTQDNLDDLTSEHMSDHEAVHSPEPSTSPPVSPIPSLAPSIHNRDACSPFPVPAPVPNKLAVPSPQPKVQKPQKSSKPTLKPTEKKPKGSRKKDTDSTKIKKAKDYSMKSEITKVDIPERFPSPVQVDNSSTQDDKELTDPDEASAAAANQIPPDPLQRRVRWRAENGKKQADSSERESSSESAWKRKEGGWLFGDEDYSIALVDKESSDDKEPMTVGPPPLPALRPRSSDNDNDGSKLQYLQKVSPELADKYGKKKYGKKQRDASWEEEQRRRRLAEERRERALEMYERLRQKRFTDDDEELDLSDGPRFEDSGDYEADNDHRDGWLAQYCIFQRYNLELFKRTYEAVDDGHKGHLGPIDTILALRAINNKLSLTEEEYLYRIMEMAGYNISAGSDFKLYAIMAALSQRIAALDDWMKHLIGQMDFSTMERKMFMCKTLWECNVDRETNTISIDQLCVELRAGGVSYEHEIEVREKLGHLGSLDLLDFMTYIPLFIMIHESVVRNPLDDSRQK